MVCEDEIHDAVQQTFGLAALPAGTSTWQDGLFTCTYRLPSGPLTLTVNDALAAAGGRSYFNDLRDFDGAPPLLQGLQAFGLPSYETADGRVVFLKDGKTLAVDAGRLPKVAGPDGQSRTDVAYAVAADVIGCWSFGRRQGRSRSAAVPTALGCDHGRAGAGRALGDVAGDRERP